MAVYEFRGTVSHREDRVESGTVVARSEEDALHKLEGLELSNCRLRKLGGFRSLWKQFTADIR